MAVKRSSNVSKEAMLFARVAAPSAVDTHRDRALVALASRLLGLHLLSRRLGRPCDPADDIRHGAGAGGPEDLYGDDVGVLGHAVLCRSDRAGDVSSVPVAIRVDIVCEAGGER